MWSMGVDKASNACQAT
ncbi:hypothetical protein ACHAWT_006314 [Skeletonema menzelii]